MILPPILQPKITFQKMSLLSSATLSIPGTLLHSPRYYKIQENPNQQSPVFLEPKWEVSFLPLCWRQVQCRDRNPGWWTSSPGACQSWFQSQYLNSGLFLACRLRCHSRGITTDFWAICHSRDSSPQEVFGNNKDTWRIWLKEDGQLWPSTFPGSQ